MSAKISSVPPSPCSMVRTPARIARAIASGVDAWATTRRPELSPPPPRAGALARYKSGGPDGRGPNDSRHRPSPSRPLDRSGPASHGSDRHARRPPGLPSANTILAHPLGCSCPSRPKRGPPTSIRGPGTTPLFMACLSPTSPYPAPSLPRSRTVVTPAMSVARACTVARATRSPGDSRSTWSV